MINPRFSVSLYDDLNQELRDLRWFPEYVEQEYLSQINGLAAVQVRIDGLEDDNHAWYVSMASLEIAARSILEQVFPIQLLVAVEGRPPADQPSSVLQRLFVSTRKNRSRQIA